MTNSKTSKKILYITGTRADFGKIKSIVEATDLYYENHILVTGMHMLKRHGLTWNEVVKFGHGEHYPYVNQNVGDALPQVLAKTISGVANIINELKPDLVVVHGDRVEALAGALVSSLTGTLSAHIEGGEISGTVDEMIRHSISKLANHHFVSNESAKSLLIQMGEAPSSIHVIGSPEIDVMQSDRLPNIAEVKSRYSINFEKYAIAILHPVVTEVDQVQRQTKAFFNALEKSELQYVIIEPNNDPGADCIFQEIQKRKQNANFRVIPSMRFEYYLALMKESQFLIGNSSSGVRECSVFGIPSINVGSRQNGRANSNLIINVENNERQILEAINKVFQVKRNPVSLFGSGGSSQKFLATLKDEKFWQLSLQKIFFKSNKDNHELRYDFE